MRRSGLILATLLLAACTGMLVGGDGGYDTDQRNAATITADTKIDSSIAARLNDDPMLGQSDVRAETYNGTVTLKGSVNNYSARNKAGRIASETAGVVNVNNQIVVQN